MFKLKLAKHNIHFFLYRAFALTVWSTCVLHYAIGLHQYVVQFFVLVWFIYIFTIRVFVQPHTICGAVEFGESSVTARYKDGKINDFQYRKVTFVYGGYYGSNIYIVIVYLIDGPSKDGVSNFLVFDDDPTKKIRIMLHSKKEYRTLRAYLDKLRDNGKEVVVTNYTLYQIKTYFKQFKQFINEKI